MDLTWTVVPGATRYRVFRSVSGVWDPVPIAYTERTSLTDSGLTNGISYGYTIAGLNSGGTGPLSTEATAMPLAPPQMLTATAADRQVSLTWLPTVGATSYVVFRSTSWDASTFARVASVTTTTHIDTGLANLTRYIYSVRAFGPGGSSVRSQSVPATPVPPPPATAPASVTAAPGNARVSLTWDAVEGATTYRIWRSTTGEFLEPYIATVTSTTFTNTGLTNGVTYSYRVKARNVSGGGPFSDVVTATPLSAPSTPTGVSATPGDATVSVTWTPVSTATSYKVFRTTAPDETSPAPIASGLTAPPFVDNAVQNAATYYYRVSAVNYGGESRRSHEVNATPEAPPVPVDPETAAAYRFLRQATWGPRPGDVPRLKDIGVDAFLAEQFAAPASTYPTALFEGSVEDAQEHFMHLALTGPDQLRQRVAWALHKIWVVSAVEVDCAPAIITYYQRLMNRAFGNYRGLMRAITLNPAMGRYLNMLNNRSQGVTGVPPNENYARELMQLFTLGTARLNANGTPMLDANGAPVPTYTEADVKELARILTGWTFGDGDPATLPGRPGRENDTVPMEAVERYHDSGAKTFLGEEFPAGQTAAQDLDQALDVIFNHPNVGPFISRQLIQQLVTSNPSPAYVASVASVFDNDNGTRGDLSAVVRAILMHPEAGLSTPTSGKLAEPVLFVVSMLRAVNATVTDHPFMSDKVADMGQRVFYPPSVFSYFSPGYRVRGTGTPPLGGPEFQGLTSVTALERANFVGDLLGRHFGDDVTIDYSSYEALAPTPLALVDYCNRRFMGGRMSLDQQTDIVAAVRATRPTDPRERVRTAIYLTLVAAQAQVDR